MIVVADTTPINYLVLIGHGNILESLYGRILVPHAVLDELLRPKTPLLVRQWASNPPVWLEILSPSASVLQTIKRLDAGETEAIALAEELRADWLLIDETAGRTEAIKRGLQTIGTLGILREAHRSGLLDLKPVLLQLQQAGFHVSRALIDQLLASL